MSSLTDQRERSDQLTDRIKQLVDDLRPTVAAEQSQKWQHHWQQVVAQDNAAAHYTITQQQEQLQSYIDANESLSKDKSLLRTAFKKFRSKAETRIAALGCTVQVLERNSADLRNCIEEQEKTAEDGQQAHAEQLRIKQTEVNERERHCKSLERQLQEASAKESQLDLELRTMAIENKKLQEEVKAADEAQDDAIRDLKTERQHHARRTSQLHASITRYEEVETQLKSLNDTFSTDLNEAKAKVKQLRDELDKSRSETTASVAQAKYLTAEVDKELKNIETFRKGNEALREQLEASLKEAEDLKQMVRDKDEEMRILQKKCNGFSSHVLAWAREIQSDAGPKEEVCSTKADATASTLDNKGPSDTIIDLPNVDTTTATTTSTAIVKQKELTLPKTPVPTRSNSATSCSPTPAPPPPPPPPLISTPTTPPTQLSYTRSPSDLPLKPITPAQWPTFQKKPGTATKTVNASTSTVPQKRSSPIVAEHPKKTRRTSRDCYRPGR